ncbi:glycosyltransferase [Flavobacterium sp.]|uniref:glycosyltransferase n=1 Tax=Flavobacterium sp. TaxID=239 RepID=UPI00248A71DC|nr:glycosyltransferase [Flavobacterium sp.]MDI1316513.1 glycosyltransferase [Flavobacterium sp.]
MKNNNKIAIVSASLGVGGAERFAGLLSFMLFDLGYDVHNIIIQDYVDYDYKGTLINLGKLVQNEKEIFRAVKKGKYIANYLADNNIQIIIDNRSRPMFLREVLTKWIYGNRKVYFMVHSFNSEMYFPRFSLGVNYLYKKASKLVCVSKGIETTIYQKFNLTNTTTIYNPIILPESESKRPDEIPEKYIIYFGRLEEEIKNFTLLLNGFSISKVYENGIKLLIVGNGKDKDFIQFKIKELQLENHVMLLPFQKNINPYVQFARCSVLTSRFEGFPMSIIESLAMGVPVISVDCETGPKEIIQNEFNGLLIPNHDANVLAEAIRTMFKDENLYQICKNNAQKSVEHLSLTTIAQQWNQLLAEK